MLQHISVQNSVQPVGLGTRCFSYVRFDVSSACLLEQTDTPGHHLVLIATAYKSLELITMLLLILISAFELDLTTVSLELARPLHVLTGTRAVCDAAFDQQLCMRI